MKETYFNLLDDSEFGELKENEQKKILIDKKIYIIGKSDNIDYNFEEYEFWRGSSNYPKYLGKDIEYDGTCYRLNDEFLDEVFNTWKVYFIEKSLKFIENNLKTVKLKIEFSQENYLNDLQSQINTAYQQKLSNKLFQELHLSRNESEEKHFEILKKHLKFNWYDLSDYIFGLKNISSYQISSQYYTFINCIKQLDLISTVNLKQKYPKRESTLTLPKSIALLNEIGFFDLTFYQSLSTLEKKNKLVALILGLDYDNKNVLRSIQGNTSILLNGNSSEDPVKYTSYTHQDWIKKEIEKILNS